MGAATWRGGQATLRTFSMSRGPGQSAAVPFEKAESGALPRTQGPPVLPFAYRGLLFGLFFFFHDGGVWHQIWFHFRGLGTKHAM